MYVCPFARFRQPEDALLVEVWIPFSFCCFYFRFFLMFQSAVGTGRRGETLAWHWRHLLLSVPLGRGFPLWSLRSGWDWPCRSSSRYARVQGRITTSSTSLLCTSWHVTAAEAARLMFCVRPVWNSGSLSDPHNLTAPSILELTSFTLPVFRAKHLNTVYRYKVGAQRMSLNSIGFVLCKNAK